MAVAYETPESETTAGRRPREPYSIGDLFKKLRNETTTLIRQEVELAKVETVEKARVAARNGMLLGVGGTVVAAGGLLVLLGFSFVISDMLVSAMGVGWMHALWMGPLIMGGLTTIVGFILLRQGRIAFKQESVIPERTVQSLQEDQQWVKQKLT